MTPAVPRRRINLTFVGPPVVQGEGADFGVQLEFVVKAASVQESAQESNIAMRESAVELVLMS
jgi:hypothetical protein